MFPWLIAARGWKTEFKLFGGLAIFLAMAAGIGIFEKHYKAEGAREFVNQVNDRTAKVNVSTAELGTKWLEAVSAKDAAEAKIKALLDAPEKPGDTPWAVTVKVVSEQCVAEAAIPQWRIKLLNQLPVKTKD